MPNGTKVKYPVKTCYVCSHEVANSAWIRHLRIHAREGHVKAADEVKQFDRLREYKLRQRQQTLQAVGGNEESPRPSTVSQPDHQPTHVESVPPKKRVRLPKPVISSPPSAKPDTALDPDMQKFPHEAYLCNCVSDLVRSLNGLAEPESDFGLSVLWRLWKTSPPQFATFCTELENLHKRSLKVITKLLRMHYRRMHPESTPVNPPEVEKQGEQSMG
jgi:hypothetical protein